MWHRTSFEYTASNVSSLSERGCDTSNLLKSGSCPDLYLLSKDIGISDTFCIDIKPDYSASNTFCQMNCVAARTATYFQN